MYFSRFLEGELGWSQVDDVGEGRSLGSGGLRIAEGLFILDRQKARLA